MAPLPQGEAGEGAGAEIQGEVEEEAPGCSLTLGQGGGGTTALGSPGGGTAEPQRAGGPGLGGVSTEGEEALALQTPLRQDPRRLQAGYVELVKAREGSSAGESPAAGAPSSEEAFRQPPQLAQSPCQEAEVTGSPAGVPSLGSDAPLQSVHVPSPQRAAGSAVPSCRQGVGLGGLVVMSEVQEDFPAQISAADLESIMRAGQGYLMESRSQVARTTD